MTIEIACTTAELIEELERQARAIDAKPEEPDVLRDLLIMAAYRLRIYEQMGRRKRRVEQLPLSRTSFK